MRKPTASSRKNDRSRAVAVLPRAKAKKTVVKRSGKAATGRNADARSGSARPDAPNGDRRTGPKLMRRASPADSVATSVIASRGKYVYCIIEAAEPLQFGPVGIGADPSDV